MAEAHDLDPPHEAEGEAAVRRRRAWPWLLGGASAVLVLAFGVAWSERNTIAGNVIERQLRQNGLTATYRIDHIGPTEQVLDNIVVGDPRHPDLTIARARVRVVYTLGLPRIGTVTLDHPRLYGRIVDGRLSFGSLDKFLAGKPGEKPAGLPNLDLDLHDGRARIDSPFGEIDAKLDGKGVLSGGFSGVLRGVALEAHFGGCTVRGAALDGRLTTLGSAPRFVGPVRLGELACPGSGLRLAGLVSQTDLAFDRDLGGAKGSVSIRGGPSAAGGSQVEQISLDGDLGWHGGVIDARLQGSTSGVTSPDIALALASFDGTLRATGGRIELEGSLDGQGVQPGRRLDARLLRLQDSTSGTLLAPMIGQVRNRLLAERRGSRLTARFDLRRSGDRLTVSVPEARLSGGSGAVLAAVSHASYARTGSAAPRLSGNLVSGGPGMPRVSGRFAEGPGGLSAQLALAEYRAGDNTIAVPRLVLAWAQDGSLGFVGDLRLTGAIPGGRAQGLAVPFDGSLASNGVLSLIKGCTTARFDRLTLGEMELDRRALTLCPQHGAPIVRTGPNGTSVAAGAPSLDLAGKFGGAAMHLRSGPVGFAWPGTLDARTVDLALGTEDRPTRLRLDHLTARLGKGFSGDFAGLRGQIAAVPLDLGDGAGKWRYAGGKLGIEAASFALTDSESPARFERMVARDATLTLANGAIEAQALLREPKSDRPVLLANIRHDLSQGAGHADLAVRDLVFDKMLQPTDLTPIAKGVVANAAGRIDGTGRIDWGGAKVTSTGTFSTRALDLAAPFGPMKGLSGSLRFTDLLGLVTAPNQVLRVASINPGIEVNDGVIRVALLPDKEAAIEGAEWPFEGGTLHLEPVRIHFGVAEQRDYVLVVEGLDAARFVEHMQLGNLRATGIFDGRLPLVFRGDVGRIEGGHLVSRPPGGNVSYVGALSYKDLSAMGNFAFESLKSLDYRKMTIGMDGDLAGEVVTRVRFDGVKQGLGTKKNVITRQIAKLPLQFNVNVTAPFYQLIGLGKSLYDTSTIADPRDKCLIDAQGKPIPLEQRVQTCASRVLP